jgi:hypothetical protein
MGGFYIGPKHFYEGAPVKHFALQSGTSGSTSVAAPGTGLVYLPFYAWMTGSAIGSFSYFNGTGGSALFSFKNQAGGAQDVMFHEEPSRMLGNQCAVLEAGTAGVGVNEFHVWAVIVRGAAGAGGTVQ